MKICQKIYINPGIDFFMCVLFILKITYFNTNEVESMNYDDWRILPTKMHQNWYRKWIFFQKYLYLIWRRSCFFLMFLKISSLIIYSKTYDICGARVTLWKMWRLNKTWICKIIGLLTRPTPGEKGVHQNVYVHIHTWLQKMYSRQIKCAQYDQKRLS
jgi:hypothetical protein